MKRSTDRIRTTHAGRLPVSPGLENLPVRLYLGEVVPLETIAEGVAYGVRRQLDIGIDCVGDGEFWKARDFIYYDRHLTGLERRPLRPGETGSTRTNTRERDEFAQFYKDSDKAGTIFYVPGERPTPPERECTVAKGPIKSKGIGALAQEIAAFKAALARAGRPVDETFFCVIAPGWLDHFIYNEYYKTEEEFVFALADALREEYLAIVDAGFILQIDDPGLVGLVGHAKPALSVDDYRNRFARLRIDALNHALKGIPEDRVRYHLCWGTWHGPHTHDLPFEHIVKLMLEVKAQCYSFEAANVRHEHEWKALAGREAARRQDDPAGRGQPLDQSGRAPGAGRRAHRALCLGGRPRECHRRHRLRPRRARARRDRLGQARRAGRGRAAGVEAAVAVAELRCS